jgi:hypothetical protein
MEGRLMASPTDELLASLRDAFRYSEALRRISERQLRRLLDDGAVVAFSRGLYRKSDWLGDEDLAEIARRPRGRRSACGLRWHATS